MTDIFTLVHNNNLVTQSSVTELANSITEEQKKQINYQLICSALEKAIVEIYANYPNSEVTNELRNKVNTYLAELQVVLNGRI
jgi:hypothetical protein